MKKMELSSNKSALNPESSLRSVGSASPAILESPIESSLPPNLLKLEFLLRNLRNEDSARWGAYLIEDLGVLAVDLVIGSSNSFGGAIRAELCTPDQERLTERWRLVAKRLLNDSPGTNNHATMLASLCLLASAHLYLEERFCAKKAQ